MSEERKKLKAKAWKACSDYIRYRECLETTGDPDLGVCCSCGRVKVKKELDAGHYIQGRKDNVLFVDELIHIQCQYCNRRLGGNYLEYRKYMVKRYGEKKVERFEDIKWIKSSLSIFDLKALLQDYKEKLSVLKGKL